MPFHPTGNTGSLSLTPDSSAMRCFSYPRATRIMVCFSINQPTNQSITYPCGACFHAPQNDLHALNALKTGQVRCLTISLTLTLTRLGAARCFATYSDSSQAELNLFSFSLTKPLAVACFNIDLPIPVFSALTRYPSSVPLLRAPPPCLSCRSRTQRQAFLCPASASGGESSWKS